MITNDSRSPRADEGSTLCLTCGVQLLDKDHLDWCANRVHRRDEGASISPETRATAQPPFAEPPTIAHEARILDRFKREIRGCGLVGEERNAATLYLILTSRLLDRQVSAGVKGHSSSGKSYTVERVVRYFPPGQVIEFTAMSERALVYSTQEFKHRTLVIYEVVALREGIEDNLTAYFVRSLLSEGQIKYETTVRDKNGGFTTKTITKMGPTNLVFTTTQTRVHAENETRVLSLNTDDSRAQTARVFLELANEGNGAPDVGEWHELQRWLVDAEHRVTIPYAQRLAEQIEPVAVRLRRDFAAVLALIRAHAVLHQLSRGRDEHGRIVATVEDFEVVRDLVSDAIATGVEATVPETVRETVAAVEALATDEGVMARAVADKLSVDKSTASRRLRMAADGGYVRNLEDRRGKPGRWITGDPMPEDRELLPQPRNLTERATAGPASGCAVAGDFGGIERGPGDLSPMGEPPEPDPSRDPELQRAIDEDAAEHRYSDAVIFETADEKESAA
jgi:hypothetical protein